MKIITPSATAASFSQEGSPMDWDGSEQASSGCAPALRLGLLLPSLCHFTGLKKDLQGPLTPMQKPGEQSFAQQRTLAGTECSAACVCPHLLEYRSERGEDCESNFFSLDVVVISVC